MDIAIIGWGSLIWDPRDLPRKGAWQKGGPVLPIEFSRISCDCRLTLVIDDDNGELLSTRFVRSPRSNLQDAIADLRDREGTVIKRIGFADLVHDEKSLNQYPGQTDVSAAVKLWATETDFDAAVWTALPPSFHQQSGKEFSLDNAVQYLEGLPKNSRQNALKYIENAPEEIDTPLRRRLRELGMIGLCHKET